MNGGGHGSRLHRAAGREERVLQPSPKAVCRQNPLFLGEGASVFLLLRKAFD